MAKYRYVIIDKQSHPFTIYGYFTDLEEAKDRCYELRKKRYANRNIIKEIEYDQIKVDMQYNVYKISEAIF